MKWIKHLLMTATVLTALLFTGVRLLSTTHAVQISPVPTLPPPAETAAEPLPEFPPETQIPPDPRIPACEEAAGRVQAGCVFVYDVTGREMLFSNIPATQKIYPASITKLFSAYVALQYLAPNTVITAGWELGMLKPGSSTAFIAMDSRLTAEMLVEAMLLPSGNDAAYILSAAAGRAIAGQTQIGARKAVAVFLEEMNRMGQELGLANSHFENPDGYHHENHYSCSGDLATIGELALQNAVIAKYARRQQDSVRFASGETITWYNTNRLLNPESAWYCEKAIGLKTGYTTEAGYCLLSAFEEAGQQYLVGIFDAENTLSRYSDAVMLFETASKAGDG